MLLSRQHLSGALFDPVGSHDIPVGPPPSIGCDGDAFVPWAKRSLTVDAELGTDCAVIDPEPLPCLT
jgi:hypothetical protein